MIEIIIAIILSLPIGTTPTDVNKDKKATTDNQTLSTNGGTGTWNESGN